MKSFLTGITAVLLLGCGGTDGPQLYQLSGEVKFEGQPLPYGRIEFEPDVSKGNSGGIGYADIVEGKYDTATSSGRGVIGGPHIVRFYGSSEKPQEAAADGTLDETAASASSGPEGASAKGNANLPLVSGYEQAHDVKKEDGTLNFELPPEASAAAAKAASVARRPGNEP